MSMLEDWLNLPRLWSQQLSVGSKTTVLCQQVQKSIVTWSLQKGIDWHCLGKPLRRPSDLFYGSQCQNVMGQTLQIFV